MEDIFIKRQTYVNFVACEKISLQSKFDRVLEYIILSLDEFSFDL